MKHRYIESTIEILRAERDEVQLEMSELDAKVEWARGDSRRMAVLNRQIVDLDGAIQRLESYLETL